MDYEVALETIDFQIRQIKNKKYETTKNFSDFINRIGGGGNIHDILESFSKRYGVLFLELRRNLDFTLKLFHDAVQEERLEFAKSLYATIFYDLKKFEETHK